MKKLKKFFRVFAVVLIVANFLSCTNENEINNQEITENQKNENVLKIFYDAEFSFGEVIELKNENLIIKEVIINNYPKRRGYITIHKLNNTLMYLADIDQEKLEIVGIDYFK
ncbi:MAG: hypothetical protein QNK89_06750 [Lacinutrix sp.]|uniref:hypothetical protein n=1 Tax=Lacinutrix sp. TaxID=1937692 RepID=UPI00309A8231